MTHTRSEPQDGRREFIRKSTLLAVSCSLPFWTGCNRGDDDVAPDEEECSTTADILGPFYKADAPFREVIIPDHNLTEPLVVKGTVLSDCNTALEGAVVEIWNANENGRYDMSDNFNFRGSYKTGTDGAYRFKTIIPGRYLNGNTFRPSHIHFLIRSPGYRDLISQIYFKDDPFIDDDPWAGSAQASKRILDVGKDTSGIDTVNFNIYLKS